MSVTQEPVQELTLTDIDSSNIDSLSYDRSTQNLAVKFKTGPDTYVYSDVPVETAIDFIDAESKGKFFAENIRGEYEWTKI